MENKTFSAFLACCLAVLITFPLISESLTTLELLDNGVTTDAHSLEYCPLELSLGRNIRCCISYSGPSANFAAVYDYSSPVLLTASSPPRCISGKVIPILYASKNPSIYRLNNEFWIFCNLGLWATLWIIASLFALIMIRRAKAERFSDFAFERLASAPLQLFLFLEKHQLFRNIFATLRFGHKHQAEIRMLMLTMLVKMVDLDGTRDSTERQLVERYASSWFGESKEAQIRALRYIRELHENEIPLETYIKQFARLFSWSFSLRLNAFDLLIQAAAVNGRIDPKEDAILRKAAVILDVPEDEYERLIKNQDTYFSGGPKETDQRTNFNYSYEQKNTSAETFHSDSWAQVLGCKPGCTHGEMKKAYRRLVKLYHPDVLRNHGLPKELQKTATDRFRKIQEAYEAAEEFFSKRNQRH